MISEIEIKKRIQELQEEEQKGHVRLKQAEASVQQMNVEIYRIQGAIMVLNEQLKQFSEKSDKK